MIGSLFKFNEVVSLCKFVLFFGVSWKKNFTVQISSVTISVSKFWVKKCQKRKPSNFSFLMSVEAMSGKKPRSGALIISSRGAVKPACILQPYFSQTFCQRSPTLFWTDRSHTGGSGTFLFRWIGRNSRPLLAFPQRLNPLSRQTWRPYPQPSLLIFFSHFYPCPRYFLTFFSFGFLDFFALPTLRLPKVILILFALAFFITVWCSLVECSPLLRN